MKLILARLGGVLSSDKSGRLSVTLRRSGAPIEIRTGRNSSDWAVFQQVFIQRQYSPLLAITDSSLILDCGANVGYATVFLLEVFPNAKVILVEPDAENAAQCLKNTSHYGDRVTVLNAALWSHCCVLSLAKGEFGDGRDWATQVRPAKDGETASITALDMPALLAMSGNSEVSILKIDIERSELEVFRQQPLAWLGRIHNLAIELHDQDCRDVFLRSLSAYTCRIEEHLELTLCLDLKPLPSSADGIAL